MKVRDLEWRDFHDLIANYYALYDELPENPTLGITLFARKPSLANEARWFGGKFAEVLEGVTVASVAEIDGRAVGMCEVRQVGPSEEHHHLGLLGITIAKAYRDRGVGAALMASVLEKCRGKFERIELSVFSDNERAKHLYVKFGFVTTGREPGRIKRGDRYLDEERMQLDMSRYSPPPPRSPHGAPP